MNEPTPQNNDPGRTPGISEQTEAIGQVSELMKAGVPLAAGFRTLSEEASSRRMRKVFRRLSEKIAQGESLEQALIEQRPNLPEWLQAVLSAGVKSGRLPECIQHFIAFSRARSGIRIRLLTCLLYPAVLIVTGLAISAFLCVWLIPQFRAIYEGFGITLPRLTEALISLSRFGEFIADNIQVTLLIIAGVFGAVWLFGRSVYGAAGIRRIQYGVPLLGRMLKLHSLAEFSQMLGLLTEARMPLHESFRLAGDATRDPNLAEGAFRAADFLEQGKSLTDLRELVPELPDELLRTPGWRKGGEALLPESLLASSEIFTLQSEVSGRSLAGILTPVTVIAAGSMIVLTVIGLFLPLLRLLNDLS